ncbi:MAG: Uma2 family endonuclease [Limnochordales bacterium]|nr:Uma2 family endonuclease [Limnochordales bacterium]
MDAVLATNQSFQPDILFVAKDRLHTSADHAVLGAPDLVVEVLSPSTRDFDLGRKREIYFRERH